MICHTCDTEIKGKLFTRNIATCHPAVLYYKVNICSTCYQKKD